MHARDHSQPVFRALADPTRRAIISMLSAGPRPIAEIADEFEMTRPAVAKHLAILREGGLIAVEPKGRERINRLNPAALKTAADWINHFDQFWDDRLAKLKQVVEDKS
ncbi:ArsR/SmtB family transcription factor [Hyphococcus sp.]|uniref:ArsR/SmtB family transcription factor n=1 Tax=Hyphococcus sp. TaxID=2038636 RepID=UPI00208D6561|nr:MAG: transcriptional regulator [Marinicaulis sp.]